jgi:precorrin-6A synthase
VRTVRVIGIGAGDPEQITVQAIRELNAVDVFFVPVKRSDDGELARLRRDICERYIEHDRYRIVEMPDPPRRRSQDTAAQRAAVAEWRERRIEQWERHLRDELPDGGTGAFLAWGDPSLYDGTLTVLDAILARGNVEFAYTVVPGVSSVHALTARHRTTLNRVGGAVQITTGRRLRDGMPDGVDDLVVMLDGDCSFRHIDDPDVEIFWGAYLGTEDEILIAGRLGDVAGEIERVRAEARERKGWIMDTYLLRRPA